jgi:hypothetical protein
VALDGYGCQASGPFNQANFIEEGTIPPLLAIVAWPVGSSSRRLVREMTLPISEFRASQIWHSICTRDIPQEIERSNGSSSLSKY